jgi:hypothetical protein
MTLENEIPTISKIISPENRPIIAIILTLLVACSPGTNTLQPTDMVQSTGIPATELDLREANVLDVTFEHRGEGNFLFEVTLVHDDEGETPNFADSWQVEDLSGNVLGIRVLLHSHGNQPFARSETISIPQDVTEVIVRAHDMLHGHGGQSMRVDLQTGIVEPFLENSD